MNTSHATTVSLTDPNIPAATFYLNVTFTTDSTIIWVSKQTTKPPHNSILWLLRQKTLNMTQISGKTSGTNEGPMQLPDPVVVLSAHFTKMDTEININEQKQNL